MSVNEEENNLELPPSTIWNNICKIALTEDLKPIEWIDPKSLNNEKSPQKNAH